MKLHTQPKLTTSKNKRLGHGYGSGKGGHTSSRGQKGQKSRGSVRLSFTGSSWVWFKRLPFMRGKALFTARLPKLTFTLSDLDKLKSGTVVTLSTLSAHKAKCRIVGNGTLTKKLIVQVPASASAIAAIKKAGGEYRAQDQ
ncbi:MAG: hypothetical protein ACD_27C00038G0018 [uncultured bacterium]|uniref:Large ribosomal subunit protein uL15 n=2 Tax=Candidatus Collieribacteriota TaxID=1752725 RepID=A0A1F5FXE4_9BACT|nr:MAG: hypothetical protein ACD_27C00038G0018 [uncultured bacterium]KKU21617.1 MAG: 50S ribosomal protein L15 [Microgenomates group bacterium GW2011_GWF1_46_12]KKU26879.1 MAG: 50S ribosomal protein L15 [Microgenomates group bacterium GW2011_GWC1_46_16]KKU28295.1 MAG: 50S ribosomal protein L15 [Microgenomates group bacterium GW2011_GWF2_46_18]KKU44140.1 MAG: 50S ribosomal protein L15 [Microgenomates group bacterium GW2011_GWA1_46_7]KKU45518.1 MAG: 50S ribosomal protein L15 [Microgenomates grou